VTSAEQGPGGRRRAVVGPGGSRPGALRGSRAAAGPGTAGQW
jgi:hypothetical protein